MTQVFLVILQSRNDTHQLISALDCALVAMTFNQSVKFMCLNLDALNGLLEKSEESRKKIALLESLGLNTIYAPKNSLPRFIPAPSLGSFNIISVNPTETRALIGEYKNILSF